MSRTPLFDRLVDDAAVFPPGNAPLEVAVSEHLARREGPDAAHLGPLLVRAADAAELARLAAADDRTRQRPLEVGLVVRPGSPVALVTGAARALRDDRRAHVAAIELGWSTDWRAALELDLPIAVEVGLGPDQAAALDDIANAVDDNATVVAKFRTGATPECPWPDEAALARFLDATILRGLTFKLTGGLHHAVRDDHDGEPQHGLLNVVLATHEALDGSEADDLTGTLGQRDAELLTDQVSRLTAVEAARVRASFTSFGCCGVLDPLTELEALGLLPPEGRTS
ncbi:MAG: hypothetical protein L0H96_18450 [Humibacillus sp.]|nr:hypothetical protein [Humibacillus sp.]MDN5778880.1 hypothetical protein [Humibacillus sp.]